MTNRVIAIAATGGQLYFYLEISILWKCELFFQESM
jgi:hypothetical protein